MGRLVQVDAAFLPSPTGERLISKCFYYYNEEVSRRKSKSLHSMQESTRHAHRTAGPLGLGALEGFHGHLEVYQTQFSKLTKPEL